MYEILDSDYGKILNLKSNWEETLMPFIQKENVSGLCLNSSLGWRGNNVNFLTKMPNLKYLKIIDPNLSNYSVVEKLPNLEFLSLTNIGTDKLDLSSLKNLNFLSLDWKGKFSGLGNCKNLKTLYLYHYPESDLAEISELNNLKTLRVIESKIVSLDGLEKLKKITNLVLAYLNRLEDIRSLQYLSHLEIIEFEACKNVPDPVPILSCLSKLQSITLVKIKKIKSVMPLINLQNLNRIILGTTEIEDSKIKALTNLPNLRTLLFKDRKSLDISRNEVEKILNQNCY